MRRFVFSLLILVLVLGAILFLAKDWMVKVALASTVRALTGFDTKIQALRLDPVKGAFYVEGLRLFNPREFEERVFADIPELYLRMDLARLLKQEGTHIHELKLDLQELNIEKNKEGISNVSLLTSLKKTGQKEAPPPETVPKKAAPPFQLDRLELTLRRLRYHDHSGVVPKKLSVDMHVQNQIFEGISDAKSVVNIILMKALTQAPIQNLGINTEEIQNQLKGSVKTVREFGEKAFVETRKQVAEKGELVKEKILEEGKGTIEDVRKATQEEITGVFGKFRSRFSEVGEELKG